MPSEETVWGPNSDDGGALALDRRAGAALLDVDEKTLMWWERDEKLPYVSAYPAIIRFLGCEPWPEPRSLAETLLAERRKRGLPVAEAAAAAGIDEGTWRRWERGDWKVTRRTGLVLDQFLGIGTATIFPESCR